MILSNKFHTLRTKEHRDALQYADLSLKAVLNVAEFDETEPDLQTYRHFVEQERPILLSTFDSFFDPDSKHEITGYEAKRTRLISVLREYFVHGRIPQRRKEYKKRVKHNVN
jgi:hypothetical protein